MKAKIGRTERKMVERYQKQQNVLSVNGMTFTFSNHIPRSTFKRREKK